MAAQVGDTGVSQRRGKVLEHLDARDQVVVPIDSSVTEPTRQNG